jgi:hypothetical protein
MAFATHNPIFELCMNFYIKSLTSYRNDVTIFSSDNRGEFMKKSVYSVVLSDDVISEVDRLAYIKGTNRSNMINQILAEYVSLTTPEKRINDIFDELSSLLYSTDTFRELAPRAPSVMSIRSAISYKYNPTVKYTVELYRTPHEDSQGEIRVSSRTQNSALILEMLHFYNIWADIESRYGFSGQDSFEDGVFKRPLVFRESPLADNSAKNALSVGEMIADYISLFDTSLKTYFSSVPDPTRQIFNLYYDYIRSNKKII